MTKSIGITTSTLRTIAFFPLHHKNQPAASFLEQQLTPALRSRLKKNGQLPALAGSRGSKQVNWIASPIEPAREHRSAGPESREIARGGGASSWSLGAGSASRRRGFGRGSQDLLIAGVTGLTGLWVVRRARMLHLLGRGLGGGDQSPLLQFPVSLGFGGSCWCVSLVSA